MHVDISIHALREEGDLDTVQRSFRESDFYPRPPRGGRHTHFITAGLIPVISIHALREEGDIQKFKALFNAALFLSTPSARRATSLAIKMAEIEDNFYPRPPRGGRRCSGQRTSSPIRYFYPRPPRGGRPAIYDGKKLFSAISIHALREEGDGAKFSLENTALFISIHALREEGDKPPARVVPRRGQFLSTPSARRATHRHRLHRG